MAFLPKALNAVAQNTQAGGQVQAGGAGESAADGSSAGGAPSAQVLPQNSGSGLSALRAFFQANQGNASAALAPAENQIQTAVDAANKAGQDVNTRSVPNHPERVRTSGLPAYQSAIDNASGTVNSVSDALSNPDTLAGSIQSGAQGYYPAAWGSLDAQIAQPAVSGIKDQWGPVVSALQKDYASRPTTTPVGPTSKPSRTHDGSIPPVGPPAPPSGGPGGGRPTSPRRNPGGR